MKQFSTEAVMGILVNWLFCPREEVDKLLTYMVGRELMGSDFVAVRQECYYCLLNMFSWAGLVEELFSCYEDTAKFISIIKESVGDTLYVLTIDEFLNSRKVENDIIHSN